MDLDITKFFQTAAPSDYSASVAEIGARAGLDTWNAACDDAPDYPLLDTDDKRDAFRDYVRMFGAWSPKEIKAWTDAELTALLMQFIAGDIREAGLTPQSTPEDWARYEKDAESGRVSGRLYYSNGSVYYSLG